MSDPVDVYPVGLFSDRRRRRVRRGLRSYLWRQIKRGNWRAVKNYFNGYLAEPYTLPPGVGRCGSGWTEARALRSLERQYRRAGIRTGA